MTEPTKPKVGSLTGPSSAVIARSVGIVCIALGFVVGMEGLQDPASPWMRTALGLIVTGLLAQGYAMYCTIQRMRQRFEKEKTGQDKTKPKDGKE